jgi:mono/diheme cytochrome c family protein
MSPRPALNLALRGLALAALLAAAGCADLGDDAIVQGEALSFGQDVQPLLAANCTGCHSGASPSGGLRLDSVANMLTRGDSGPAIVAGAADSSLLMVRLEGGGNGIMPPTGALAPDQVERVRQWIDEGALNN